MSNFHEENQKFIDEKIEKIMDGIASTVKENDEVDVLDTRTKGIFSNIYIELTDSVGESVRFFICVKPCQ